MDRPSRSKMICEFYKGSHKQTMYGEQKVIRAFEGEGNTKLLAIRDNQVSSDFIKTFCSEHDLKFEHTNGYYYLS